jgi:SNF2 family DNA or RNA helicase
MKFKTTPFDHQLEGLELSWKEEAYALLMEMGLGKTWVAINTLARLMEAGEISRALIIAPKGVYRNWELFEIPQHWPDDVPVQVLSWKGSTDRSFENAWPRFMKSTRSVFLVNVDALLSPSCLRRVVEYLKAAPSAVVIDESTIIKSKDAKRTKVAAELGKLAKYRRIMTGSPVTNSPLDLFGQMLFLRPKSWPWGNFFSFRSRYAVMKDFKYGPRSFKKITGYQRIDELQQILASCSYRKTKAECLNLPDKIFVTRYVELSPEQSDLYKQLASSFYVEMAEADKAISMTTVLTRIVRLQQVVCGHVATDDGTISHVPHQRIQAVLDVLDESSGQVIIWAHFRHSLKELSEALKKAYGDDSVVEYWGDTSEEDRQKAVEYFKAGKARVFLANQAVAGRGLTLTQASLVIYYSNSYNLEQRVQSEDRAHRLGQKKAVTYVDLVSPDTVDEKILKALKLKQNIADQVLGDELKDWFKI